MISDLLKRHRHATLSCSRTKYGQRRPTIQL